MIWIVSLVTLIIITLALSVYAYKNDLLKNFSKIRCNPFYMPFISLINSKVSSKKNYDYCVQQTTQPGFANMFNDIASGMNNQAKVGSLLEIGLDDLFTNLSSIGQQLTSFFDRLQKKKDIIGHLFHISILKIGSMLGKIGTSVIVIVYAILSAMNVTKVFLLFPQWIITCFWLMSVMAAVLMSIHLGIAIALYILLIYAGAITNAISAVSYLIVFITLLTISIMMQIEYDAAQNRSYCCFNKSTKIITKYGNKSINDIQLNDILDNENIVLGIIQVERTYGMYLLDGIMVSGDHLIINDNHIQPVYQQSNVIPTINKDNIVYCLVTSNNRISCIGKSNTYNFLDYEEDNLCSCQIAIITLSSYNCYLPIIDKYETGDRDNVLASNSIILMYDSSTKLIQDINIGDILYDGITVIGIYKASCNPIFMDVEGIPMNARQIFYKYNQWQKVYHKYNSICNIPHVNVYYHIITDQGYLHIFHPIFNYLIIADFIETRKSDAIQKINNLIMINYSNKNK